MRHSGDLAGVGVLVVATAIAAYLVPARYVPALLWLFVFAALVATSMFVWSQPKSPTTVRGWLLWSAGAPFVAGLFSLIDAGVRGPDSGMVAIDLAFGAAGSLVGIAGLVRCFVERRRHAA